MIKAIIDSINAFLVNNKALEVIMDYKGQISYGRVGGLLCLLFSQAVVIVGFFHPENEKLLSYCSTISVQFLSAALALYIPGKASEAYSKKWAPQISDTVAMIGQPGSSPEVILPTTKEPDSMDASGKPDA